MRKLNDVQMKKMIIAQANTTIGNETPKRDNITPTEKDIEKACRDLSPQFHPDKHPGDKYATANFQLLQEAKKEVIKQFKAAKQDLPKPMAPAHEDMKASEPDLPKPTAPTASEPGPTRKEGPSWKNKFKEELEEFERTLFNAIAVRNNAMVEDNKTLAPPGQEKITIKHLKPELADQQNLAIQGPKALAIQDKPIPENKGTLVRVQDDEVALKQTTYGKGAQYQIDYTDVNGKTGSAVYDNRGEKPEIRVDHSNPASIQAGVKAAQAAGWKAVGMYDDVSQEKRDAVEQACKEHGLRFFTVPRPEAKPIEEKDAAKQIEGKDAAKLPEEKGAEKDMAPAIADGTAKNTAGEEAPKQIEVGPSAGMDVPEPPKPG